MLLSGLVAAGPALAARPASCEEMLQKVKDAVASASVAADVKAQVSALQDKGIERCKADDDARADKFFGDALMLMGK